MEIGNSDKKIRIANLPQGRIGIKRSQTKAFQHHWFNAMLTQDLHRGPQNLPQLQQVEHVVAHDRLHLGKH